MSKKDEPEYEDVEEEEYDEEEEEGKQEPGPTLKGFYYTEI